MNGTSRRGFFGMLAAVVAAPAALMAKVDDYRIKQYKHIEYGREVHLAIGDEPWNLGDKDMFLYLGSCRKLREVRTGPTGILRAQYEYKHRNSIFWSETRVFGGDTVYVIMTDFDFLGKKIPGGCVWRMTKTRQDMTRIIHKFRSLEWDALENTCLSQCSEIPHTLINGGGI